MSARDGILHAVRAALGRGVVEAALGRGAVDASLVKAEADRLLDDLPRARLDLDGQDVVDVFAARLCSARVAGTLDRIADLAGLPAAVMRYLDAKRLPRVAALQPAVRLRTIDWQGFELFDAPSEIESVGIGIADAGIAETGSLVFLSGPQTPVLAHFLPLHHVVALHARSIVMYLDDYARTALHAGAAIHRNVNIVTGPSGTTDIEGQLVFGAHGPCHLHVVLIEGAA